MSHDGSSDHQSGGLAGWITKSVLIVGMLYLFAFALLVFFPQIGKALVGAGISESVLERVFYPMLKLIGAA